MNKTEKHKPLLKENLPYEKYMHHGPEALTDSELLAIILRTGTKEKTALELAEEIISLSKFPREGLLGIYDIPFQKIMEIKGVGEVKAIKVKCIAEIALRINSATAKDGLIITKPETIAAYFMEKLRHRRKECVIMVSLDAKCQILHESLLSSGSINMSLISPREVFLEALKNDAVNIILLHNHPSGDPKPSNCDLEITKCIWEMGEKLGIMLLDHIIIGDNSYVSFKEYGYI